MFAFLLFHFYVLFPFPTNDHAIYVSVLEVDNQQMKIKVFTDNLQAAIRNDSGYTPSTSKNFHAVNHHAIEAYFQRKVQLQINGHGITFNIEEITVEGDSYWITFRLEKQEKWKSFYIEASYLMEVYRDQTNVVKLMGDKPQFFRLTKRNPSCNFTF